MMRWAWMTSLLCLGWLTLAPGVTSAPVESPVPAEVDPAEPIAAEPVDHTRLPVSPEPTPSPETDWITPDTLPAGDPYPIASPTGTPVLETPAGDESVAAVPRVYPYAVSAYLLPVDLTELDLGLIIYETPGISAGINWGAMERLMVAARLTVQGPSNIAGLRLRYGIWQEQAADSKPALAASFNWIFLNLRSVDDQDARHNVFRGNRLQGGVLLSKDLGSLARALDANDSVQGFMNYFKLHAELLVEYLAGRQHSIEEPVAQVEFGARGTVEIVIDPEILMLTLTYDSLPDWVWRDNYYLGIRYLARRDFAIDVLAGKIGEDNGLTAGLAWIF